MNFDLSSEQILKIEELAAAKRNPTSEKFDITYCQDKERFYITNPSNSKDWKTRQFFNKPLFDELLKILKDRGFKMKADPRFSKSCRRVSKYHRKGINDAIWCKAEYHGDTVSLEFYPDYAVGNPNGPEYCPNQFEQFKYLDRKKVELTISKLVDFMKSKGFKDRSEHKFLSAREAVEYSIRKSWAFKEFDTNNGVDPSLLSDRHIVDANGKKLRNGEVKYFFNYDGKLSRGHIYFNGGTQWLVVTNENETFNIYFRELFDFDPIRCTNSYRNNKKISKLRRHLEKAILEKNEFRAAILRNIIWEIDGGSPGEEYYIIQCLEHQRGNTPLWWMGGCNGYTENLEIAGLYTKKEAESICRGLTSRDEKMWTLKEAKTKFAQTESVL